MLSKFKNIDAKSKVLMKNTVMLYILQFSTYLFSFLTVPYQSRILGPEIYGVIGVAVAVMAYFQLFMDFGFLLSATEDISKNRDDKQYICQKITSIAIIKVFFVAISFVVMSLLCIFVPQIGSYKLLYFVYLAAYAVNSFLPDYIYRGLEQMTAVTVRTVIIKLFFCVMIFVVMHSKEDYMAVPVLLLIGNIGAVLGAYIHLFKTLHFRFTKVTVSQIIFDFKRSSFFFYSRIATTVYSATNTVILGMLDKTGVVTGYYTSADKILTTAKNGLSPISDSLYPYMVKNRDFKLVKKVLTILMPIIVAGCVVVGIFAEFICTLVFGKEYVGAANILRAFLPAIASILPSYIFGFPVMGALGISKYANRSIFIGTAIHIVGLTLLVLTGNFSAVSLAGMTSVTEISIMAYRVAVVAVYKKRVLAKGDVEK